MSEGDSPPTLAKILSEVAGLNLASMPKLGSPAPTGCHVAAASPLLKSAPAAPTRRKDGAEGEIAIAPEGRGSPTLAADQFSPPVEVLKTPDAPLLA